MKPLNNPLNQRRRAVNVNGMTHEKLAIGQRIYYAGDAANDPDFGIILDIKEPTPYSGLCYLCNFANVGCKLIEAYNFSYGIGQRYKTLEQYEEERAEMRAYFKSITSTRPS